MPLGVLASPITDQKENNGWRDNPEIVGVGRRFSESLEQGLVMAPPRARMTNDRSTGVAARVNLTGIGMGRRLVENKTLRRGILCRKCGEVESLM